MQSKANSPLCSCSSWHVPPRFIAEDASPYAHLHTFCVVRDPADKALSEYKMRYIPKDHSSLKANNGTTHPLGGNISLPVKSYAQNSRYDSPHMANKYFLELANKLTKAAGTWGQDCHLTPQHFYVWDKQGRLVHDE